MLSPLKSFQREKGQVKLGTFRPREVKITSQISSDRISGMERYIRSRDLNEQICSSTVAINTTYNDDSRVPPYMGIMFEIFPRMDLELLTMEFDIRIPRDEVDIDLSVEVYFMKGSYELFKAYEPDRWTLLKETTMALLPGGEGGIIPAQQFPTLSIAARERYSFYVTMKRSYLDHNVMALQKTGELQMTTPELDILVGTGFTGYRFPEGGFDRTLNPQFAGVFHVRRTAECRVMRSTTTVEFDLLLNKPATPDIFSRIDQTMDSIFANRMQSNTLLQSFIRDYGMVKSAANTVRVKYEGNCPTNWEYCPTYHFRTYITFTHQDALNSGFLSYNVYGDVASLAISINSALPEYQIIYIGHEAVSADITLTLLNAPSGQRMDDIQLAYFASSTIDFLTRRVDNTVRVFSLDIRDQAIRAMPGTRHSRDLANSALEIRGKLLGGDTVSTLFADDNFKTVVESAFRDSETLYLEQLITNSFRPNEINDGDRIDFFRSISNAQVSLQLDKVPQPWGKPTGGGGSDAVLFIVLVFFAVLGVSGVLVLIYWRRRRVTEDVVISQDKEIMKDFRKERDRLDREAAIAEVLETFKEQSHPTSSDTEQSKACTKETLDTSDGSSEVPPNEGAAPDVKTPPSLDSFLSKEGKCQKAPVGSSKSVQPITNVAPVAYGKPVREAEDILTSRFKAALKEKGRFVIGSYAAADDIKPTPRSKKSYGLTRSRSFNDCDDYDSPKSAFGNRVYGVSPDSRSRIDLVPTLGRNSSAKSLSDSKNSRTTSSGAEVPNTPRRAPLRSVSQENPLPAYRHDRNINAQAYTGGNSPMSHTPMSAMGRPQTPRQAPLRSKSYEPAYSPNPYPIGHRQGNTPPSQSPEPYSAQSHSPQYMGRSPQYAMNNHLGPRGTPPQTFGQHSMPQYSRPSPHLCAASPVLLAHSQQRARSYEDINHYYHSPGQISDQEYYQQGYRRPSPNSQPIGHSPQFALRHHPGQWGPTGPSQSHQHMPQYARIGPHPVAISSVPPGRSRSFDDSMENVHQLPNRSPHPSMTVARPTTSPHQVYSPYQQNNSLQNFVRPSNGVMGGSGYPNQAGMVRDHMSPHTVTRPENTSNPSGSEPSRVSPQRSRSFDGPQRPNQRLMTLHEQGSSNPPRRPQRAVAIGDSPSQSPPNNEALNRQNGVPSAPQQQVQRTPPQLSRSFDGPQKPSQPLTTVREQGQSDAPRLPQRAPEQGRSHPRDQATNQSSAAQRTVDQGGMRMAPPRSRSFDGPQAPAPRLVNAQGYGSIPQRVPSMGVKQALPPPNGPTRDQPAVVQHRSDQNGRRMPPQRSRSFDGPQMPPQRLMAIHEQQVSADPPRRPQRAPAAGEQQRQSPPNNYASNNPTAIRNSDSEVRPIQPTRARSFDGPETPNMRMMPTNEKAASANPPRRPQRMTAMDQQTGQSYAGASGQQSYPMSPQQTRSFDGPQKPNPRMMDMPNQSTDPRRRPPQV